MSLRDAFLETLGESCVVAFPSATQLRNSPNEATPAPETWLRKFLGADIVPVSAVQAAADSDGVSWHDVVLVAGEFVRVFSSQGRTYWAAPRKRIKPEIPPGNVAAHAGVRQAKIESQSMIVLTQCQGAGGGASQQGTAVVVGKRHDVAAVTQGRSEGARHDALEEVTDPGFGAEARNISSQAPRR